MYGSKYVSMYVWIYLCMYGSKCVCMEVSKQICMEVVDVYVLLLFRCHVDVCIMCFM